MNDKALSLMGLCRRARRLTIGTEQVCDEIRNENAYLICAARDFSENSKKAVERVASEYGAQILTLGYTKDELSYAVGKYCGVMCVTDKGFADKLRTLLTNHTSTTE